MNRPTQLVLGGFLCFWMGWFTHDFVKYRMVRVRAAEAQLKVIEQELRFRQRMYDDTKRAADSLTAVLSRQLAP